MNLYDDYIYKNSLLFYKVFFFPSIPTILYNHVSIIRDLVLYRYIIYIICYYTTCKVLDILSFKVYKSSVFYSQISLPIQ